MVNLTITVAEETVESALEECTSVNAMLGDHLKDYAGAGRERREAWRKMRQLARNSEAGSSGEGLPKREELYDRLIMGNRSGGPL